MNPHEIDTIAWMQQLAGRMDQLNSRTEIASAPDDIEHLMEALDPQLRESAYQAIESLRRRLEAL